MSSINLRPTSKISCRLNYKWLGLFFHYWESYLDIFSYKTIISKSTKIIACLQARSRNKTCFILSKSIMSKCIHYNFSLQQREMMFCVCESKILHQQGRQGGGTGSEVVVKCKKWRYDLSDRPLDSRLKLFIFHISWFKESSNIFEMQDHLHHMCSDYRLKFRVIISGISILSCTWNKSIFLYQIENYVE